MASMQYLCTRDRGSCRRRVEYGAGFDDKVAIDGPRGTGMGSAGGYGSSGILWSLWVRGCGS